MEANEIESKKKLPKAIFILVILIVIALISGLAYAKYRSSLNGSVSSQIAKWSFKVIDGDSSTIDVLDFPITRTDTNNQVKEGSIAPRNLWKISN